MWDQPVQHDFPYKDTTASEDNKKSGLQYTI